MQHGACGDLVDELRGKACAAMRALASGQQVAGGTQLPLADVALRALLDQHRRELKADWDSRAIGDEEVRAEYWHDLEDALLPEEEMVRKQNARFGNQRLAGPLEQWQKWLASETSTWQTGERILGDLIALMERMPAEPLARTTRTALEGAGRRVVALEQSLTERKAAQTQLNTEELQSLREDLRAAKDKVLELSEERDLQREEHEKTRTEYLRLIEETRKKFDEDRERNEAVLQGANQSLVDQTRLTGVLEGRMQALSLEASALREEVGSLQQRVRNAEHEKVKVEDDRAKLKSDLGSATARADEAAMTARKLAKEAEEARQAAAEREQERERQPKCGCVLQ